MAPAELKILVFSPSIKNWPILLALGFFIAATGLIGLVLLIFKFSTALVVTAGGVALTVWPALRSANTEYRVTNVRVVVVRGIFGKTERDMAVSGIREINILRGRFQRALGIGDLEIVGEKGVLRIEGAEEPERVRDKILSLV